MRFSRLLFAAITLLPLAVQAQDAPTRDQVLKAIGFYRDVPAAQIKTGAIKPNRQQAAFAESPDGELTCLTPVHADAELANMQVETISDTLNYPVDICEDIKSMHQSLMRLQEAQANGAGSFPVGCLSDYAEHHAVFYYVERDSFPAWARNNEVTEAWLKRIPWKLWGFRNYQQVVDRYGGLSHLDASIKLGLDADYGYNGCGHFETDDPDEAHIYLRSRYIPGSVIGYAEFNSGRCTTFVKNTIDNSWHPDEDGHGYAHLIGHEGGHNNNLQHQFTGQSGSNGHHERMSYSPYSENGYTVMYPYSRGEAEHPLKRAPSSSILARYYGGEQFPYPDIEGPEDPPVPPSGDFPYKVGDTKVELTLGRKLSWELKQIDGDDGPSLADDIRDAYVKIEDYPLKDTHRQLLGLIYAKVSESVRKGEVTLGEGIAAIKQTREAFLGITGDTGKWTEVFTIADSAPTVSGMTNVAVGLIGNDFIPKELIDLLNTIIDRVFEGKPLLQFILKTILSLLADQNAEEFVDPDAQATLLPKGWHEIDRGFANIRKRSWIVRGASHPTQAELFLGL